MFVFTGFNEDNEAKYDKLLPMLVAWSAEVSRHGIAQVRRFHSYGCVCVCVCVWGVCPRVHHV
ncbi:MAG: hypothetical protein P4L40_13780 [Terracidiphilus sp.]|nr:hypothetical protein [Terracidiphilus sp.]